MHKSRQKPLYRRNIFFRGVHGLETKVRHCRSMVRLFTYRRFQNDPPLSFGCNFSREQMTGIVACANAYHLFCVSTLRIEDMEALFACKKGFCIRVNNIRHVAVLFDALLENTFILPHWQSVLDKGGSCCPKTAQDTLPLQASRPPCLRRGTTLHRQTSAYEKPSAD